MSIIFFSGPHGAGKSTLVDKLNEELDFVVVPKLITKVPAIETNPYERTKLKVCQRALENFEVGLIEEENPNKVVLANRCIHDFYAYTEAYLNLGWITQNEHDIVCELAREFFPERFHNPAAVILNPPFGVVREHLEKRWHSDKKKWMEEDMNYLEAARNAYERFRGMPNITYIEWSDYDLVRNLCLESRKELVLA